MKIFDEHKSPYIYAFLSSVLLIIAVLFYGACNKDDNRTNQEGEIIIKATIKTIALETKTYHDFNENKLKTGWAMGDAIAVSCNGSEVSRFCQYGSLLENGHLANFICDDFKEILAAGDIIAFYPYYITIKPYSIEQQSGNIEDLRKIDCLIAKTHIESTDNIKLNFTPLCAILRIPKGFVFNTRGGMVSTLTLTGNNVANNILVSSSGEIVLEKGPVRISSSGMVQEQDVEGEQPQAVAAKDIFIVFFPIKESGREVYTIESNCGDRFDFIRDDISTSKVYSINPSSDNNCVWFEDEDFRKYCIDNFDLDDDGVISAKEADDVIRIDCGFKDSTFNLHHLKGIERFRNLKYLRVRSAGYYTSDISLDVSRNRYLDSLIIAGEGCGFLDLSNNTLLTYLDCGGNNLTSLDLSNNTLLTYLDCGGNDLTSLDLSNNTLLKSLTCGGNNLTSLDLSKNTLLEGLNCAGNNLTSLDLSKNTLLTLLVTYPQQGFLHTLVLNQNCKDQISHFFVDPLTNIIWIF